MTRAALLVVMLATTNAQAEVPLDRATAIQIDREATPLTRPEFGFDGGAPLGGGWAVALGLGYLDQPITFSTAAGDSHPVARRESATLGAAIALGASAVLEARLPLSHQVGDRLRLPGQGLAERTLDRWVMGDVAIGLRFRMVDHDLDGGRARSDAEDRKFWAVFARADLGLPTGDSGDFAGDASWTLAWSLIARVGLPAGVILAGAVGIRLRGDEVVVDDRIVSNELSGSMGIAVPLPPIHPLWCVRDLVKLTAEVAGVVGDSVAGADGPSPIEARLGLVTRPRSGVTLGFRIGTSLTSDELGGPRFRAMATVSFTGSSALSSLIPPIGEPEDLPAE